MTKAAHDYQPRSLSHRGRRLRCFAVACGAIFIGLVALHGPATANKYPDPLSPEAWNGAWGLRAHVAYSTCKELNVGDVELIVITIAKTRSGWSAREQVHKGRTATMDGTSHRRIPPTLSFRGTDGTGLDLWKGSNGVEGVRVLSKRTQRGSCAVVFNITGQLMSSANSSGQPVSKVKLGDADDLSLTSLSPGEVTNRIRGKYLVGIKRCHEKTLSLDPRAEGRVTIRFTVDPSGAVSKASVKGFDSTVDGCIEAQTTIWTFSPPKSKGRPASADFEMPMLLKPSDS